MSHFVILCTVGANNVHDVQITENELTLFVNFLIKFQKRDSVFIYLFLNYSTVRECELVSTISEREFLKSIQKGTE